jgi:hypothetical protein
MKKQINFWSLVIMLAFGVVFFACEKNTSLKVVNQSSGTITSVSLVGYEFKTLSIARGESQTFSLDNGIAAGYDNINVSVICSYPYHFRTISNTFNFNKGGTTTITLSGEHPNMILQ